MAPIGLKQISRNDLDSVLRIQESSYGKNYLESGETFRRMLEVFPRGAVFIQADGNTAGYLFFHSGFEGKIKDFDNKTFH